MWVYEWRKTLGALKTCKCMCLWMKGEGWHLKTTLLVPDSPLVLKDWLVYLLHQNHLGCLFKMPISGPHPSPFTGSAASETGLCILRGTTPLPWFHSPLKFEMPWYTVANCFCLWPSSSQRGGGPAFFPACEYPQVLGPHWRFLGNEFQGCCRGGEGCQEEGGKGILWFSN